MSAGAQTCAIKSNVLYDAAVEPNLGLEVRMDTTKTFNLSVVYNPIQFSSTRKWKALIVQPEVRFWSRGAFDGFYWGFNLLWCQFNACRMPLSLLGSDEKRYQGDMYGGGLSCGYHWILSPHWGLELGASVDYLHISYERYRPGYSRLVRSGSRNYVGPSALSLSFVYFIK